MILIITSKRDGHIQAVTEHLDKSGKTWVRLNTEDFAKNAVVTVEPQRGTGMIYFRDSDKRVELSSVEAVWYRKPDPVDLSHFALERAALDYVEAEFNENLLGLYALLRNARWINDPFTTRIAHRKLLQLRVATEVGFQTPRTVVTNDVETALRFAEEVDGDLAIKSLAAVCVTQGSGAQTTQFGIFTRRVTAAELEEAKDKIPHQPTLFQQFIEKQYELRITCIGENVFPCRIEPREGDLTSDDCRFDTQRLKHEPCDCPELHEKLHAYMRAFDLRFAAFDILVSKRGEPIFAECNPNGQWLWVQNLTGLAIGKAIADELSVTPQEE